MGLHPVIVPLFEVAPLDWTPPPAGGFDAIAMTSANAARHGGRALARYRHLPLLAVGEATARAARDAGFADIRLGSGTADDLGDLVAGQRVLHLRGHESVGLPGTRITSIAVYAAPQRTLTDRERAELDCPFALIHSPRAGRALAAVVSSPAKTSIIAISADAAAAVASRDWRAMHIAATPREGAMLEVLAALCKAPPRDIAGSD